MSRQLHLRVTWLLLALTAFTGCHPAHPFFYGEDGDLSHLVDRATDIEHPDNVPEPLPDAARASAPLTLTNPDFKEFWDLTLEECIHIAMQNSKVLRQDGNGRQDDQLLRNPESLPTIYDAARQATTVQNQQAAQNSVFGGGTGLNGDLPSPLGNANTLSEVPGQTAGQSVVDALADFDGRFRSQFSMGRNDQPQNVNALGFRFFGSQSNSSNFQAEIQKKTVSGSSFYVRHRTDYFWSNQQTRAVASDYLTQFDIGVFQPLLQGRGTQIQRIPIVVGRIAEDQSLADFEAGVRNQVMDIENAYWDLFRSYRILEAQKIGRDAALATWQWVHVQLGQRKNVADEARARHQYFEFRRQVEQALAGGSDQGTTRTGVFENERRLRFLMGLAPTDSRLIRPITEPTLARVEFAWNEAQAESLFRSAELRKQRWEIKAAELRVIAARNRLLPQLNLQANYNWLGAGDELITADRRGLDPFQTGSTAFDSLTQGNFQEANAAIVFAPNAFGARREHALVRNSEIQLARAKAVLEDMELNVSHLLTQAIRNHEFQYLQIQASLNQLHAAKEELQALEDRKEIESETINFLLDAQRRRVQAQIEYYSTMTEYNKQTAFVHFRKGTLLEYDNVCLEEGPWPEKAYFDAMRRARERDASYYLDYGWTRPSVISGGAVPQKGTAVQARDIGGSGAQTKGPVPGDADPQVPNGPRVEPQDDPPVGPITRAGRGTVQPASHTTTRSPSRSANGSYSWGDLGLPETKDAAGK